MYFVSPQVEAVDVAVRIVGWPSLIGGVIWIIRKWDSTKIAVQEIHENTKLAVEKVSEVKSDVDMIKINHLVHLQGGIDQLASSNEKVVTVLQNIDTNIKILADRTPR
jgi:hypothetical protein